MPGDTSEYTKDPRKRVSLCLLVVVFLAILFFGLNPRTLSFSNHVDWIKNQSGIRFDKYGIAYTNVFTEEIRGEVSDSKAFSFEIALKQEKTNENNFKYIFVFHNGQDRSQFLMAQWRSWIILMNGKTEKLAVDTALLPEGPLFFTLTTNSFGTSLYFEGRLIRKEKNLTFDFSNGGEVRLVLGNSVYGKHSWQGDIYGFAFYQSTLADQDVESHFLQWSKERNFSFAKTAKPLILFLFDEKEGRWASDYSGGTKSLHIPPKIKALERKFLMLPRQQNRFNTGSMMDIFLNVLGFMPLGFLLSATLADLGGNFRKYGVVITVGLCLIMSLSIEIVQAWLPLRDSSLLDLILNVFGGWIGSRTYISWCRHFYDELIRTVFTQPFAR